MNGFDDTKATTRLAVLTGLCGLALGCNLVVPMFFRDVDYQSLRLYPWYCSGGALVAEICLLGIWCGLSLQAIKYRLPVTLSLLLVVVCSYWVGLQLPDEDIPSVIAALVAAGAFGMFAILQLPLWVMRYCSPRRITLGNTELHGNRVRGSQFSVRYLMLWTTLTGLLLVTVRHSLPTARTGISGPEVVSIPLVMFAYAGFSTAFCLPWIWILLGEKHSLRAALVLVAALILGPFLMSYVARVVIPPIRGTPLVLPISCYALGLTATTAGVVFVWRLLGYRFMCVAAGPPAIQEGEGAHGPDENAE